MKAIIINENGFMKRIEVQKKTPIISSLGFSSIRVNFLPFDDPRLKDVPVPVISYELEREYTDEHNETFLIYREMP